MTNFENFAKEWEGFAAGKWCDSIDVREFIQKNYSPYIGDESFLAEATPKTKRLFAKLGAGYFAVNCAAGKKAFVSSLVNDFSAVHKFKNGIIIFSAVAEVIGIYNQFNHNSLIIKCLLLRKLCSFIKKTLLFLYNI